MIDRSHGMNRRLVQVGGRLRPVVYFADGARLVWWFQDELPGERYTQSDTQLVEDELQAQITQSSIAETLKGTE